MSRFHNKKEFAEYCLKMLGDGVINIEISDEQICHVIDDSIYKFQRSHHDASERVVLAFDRNPNSSRYIMPDKVIAVDEVLHGRYTFNYRSGSGAADEYLLFGRHNFTMKLGGHDGQVITPYVIAEQYYQTLMHNMVPVPDYEFSEVSHVLKFFSPHDRRNTFNRLDTMMVLVRAYYTEDEWPDMYNHEWLREYAICRLGEKWGENINKYDNIKTVGGGVLNGQGILHRYQMKRQEMEEKLTELGQAPIIWIQ